MSTQPGIELDEKGNPRKYQTGDVIDGTVIKHIIDMTDIPDDVSVEEYLKEKGIDPKKVTLEKNWKTKEFVYKYPLSEEDAKKEKDRLEKDINAIEEEYKIPAKYRFKLDKNLVDKKEGKYKIIYRGQEKLIDVLNVEWAEYYGRITRADFDKILSGTKGIIEDSIKGDFEDKHLSVLKHRTKSFKNQLIDKIDKKVLKQVKEELKKPGLKIQLEKAKLTDYKDLTEDDIEKLIDKKVYDIGADPSEFIAENNYSKDPKVPGTLEAFEKESKKLEGLQPRVGAVRRLYELIDKESERRWGWSHSHAKPQTESAEIFSESKYYMPDVLEFHVGFEYEIKEPHRWIDRDYKQHRDYTWNKQIFESTTFDTEIETMDGEMPFECGFSEGTIRVKYLDGEDIKSLGFLQDDVWEWSYTSKDSNVDLIYTINFSNKGKEIFVSITTSYENEAGIEIKFSGYIKNKSELKKINETIKH